MIRLVKTSSTKIIIILENDKTYEYSSFEQLTDLEREIIHNYIITAKHSVTINDTNIYWNKLNHM